MFLIAFKLAEIYDKLNKLQFLSMSTVSLFILYLIGGIRQIQLLLYQLKTQHKCFYL